eukprot:3079351-Karenia_brevis.AAC.1
MTEPVPDKILNKKKKLQWLASGKYEPKGQNLSDSEEDEGDDHTADSWNTGDSNQNFDEGKKWREWKSNSNKRG